MSFKIELYFLQKITLWASMDITYFSILKKMYFLASFSGINNCSCTIEKELLKSFGTTAFIEKHTNMNKGRPTLTI